MVRYGTIEAAVHRKTRHSLSSQEVQDSSDAVMMPRTTSHAASSPFLRERRLLPYTTQATNGIEILEAVVGKPVRFRINNPPSSNDAWVGIYHPSSSDQEIGKQKQQWEWLRDLDVNNASLTEKYEGNWSIRVFSDGGYRLHERKDFAVKPKHVATGRARARPNKRPVIAAFVTGMFLFGIGLPLLIVGSTSTGEDRLAMIIPGAILFSVGSFSILVSAIGGLSLGGKSVPTQNTESTKPVQNPSIEVLEAVVGEPVLFRIKGQANHNDAWVGIYPRLAWRTTTTGKRGIVGNG